MYNSLRKKAEEDVPNQDFLGDAGGLPKEEARLVCYSFHMRGAKGNGVVAIRLERAAFDCRRSVNGNICRCLDVHVLSEKGTDG